MAYWLVELMAYRLVELMDGRAYIGMASHPNVCQGIPMYGRAPQYYGMAYLCMVRHPDAWQGILMYGKASQCTARYPNVW